MIFLDQFKYEKASYPYAGIGRQKKMLSLAPMVRKNCRLTFGALAGPEAVTADRECLLSVRVDKLYFVHQARSKLSVAV